MKDNRRNSVYFICAELPDCRGYITEEIAARNKTEALQRARYDGFQKPFVISKRVPA